MGVRMEGLVIMTRGSATVEMRMFHTIITANILDQSMGVSKHVITHVHHCGIKNNSINVQGLL